MLCLLSSLRLSLIVGHSARACYGDGERRRGSCARTTPPPLRNSATGRVVSSACSTRSSRIPPRVGAGDTAEERSARTIWLRSSRTSPQRHLRVRGAQRLTVLCAASMARPDASYGDSAPLLEEPAVEAGPYRPSPSAPRTSTPAVEGGAGRHLDPRDTGGTVSDFRSMRPPAGRASRRPPGFPARLHGVAQG